MNAPLVIAAPDRSKFQHAKPLAERFIEKMEIDPAGCWTWNGSVNANGYGSCWDGERAETASRLSYRLFVSAIPDGLFVLHRCDNPLCVRPSHLFLGTHADNMADRNLKGRAAKLAGELNPRAKLSAAAVQEIRRSGLRTSELAKRFDVSPTTVQRARSGKGWRVV